MKQIIALGGGGFSYTGALEPIDRYILAQANSTHPRILFVPTASGDSDSYILKFYSAFRSANCVPTHLSLFRRDVKDLERFILNQDIIFVGGGNTVNMLAIWKEHGVDLIMKQAYENGIAMSGISAGAMCWFEGGITDSYGPVLQPIEIGLGLLPGTVVPHYSNEPERRPSYHKALMNGLNPGYAIDDGAAIHVVDGKLKTVLQSDTPSNAYFVHCEDGILLEDIVKPMLVLH